MPRIYFYLLFCFALVTHPAHSEKITIATGDGRPYIFTDGLEVLPEKPGFSIEIVMAASALLGWDTQFVVLPFSRQVLNTHHGNYDGMMAIFHSDAPHFTFPEQPIGIARNCFYTRKDSSFIFTSEHSLDVIKFAVTNGYTYGEIDAYIEKNRLGNIVTMSGEDKHVAERLIAMLKTKRIDAFIEAEAVIDYHLKEKSIADVVNAGCTPTLDAFIAFSPVLDTSHSRAKAFDRAVTALRHNGDLQRILNRYNVKDWRTSD